MRLKIARSLRKVADLIDPRVKPSTDGAICIKVECDTSQAIEALDDLAKRAKRIPKGKRPCPHRNVEYVRSQSDYDIYSCSHCGASIVGPLSNPK